MADPLPSTGIASTYADRFVGLPTASGEIYRHELYTAALLPYARWKVVPLRSRYELTCNGRKVVVNINDRGAGDRTMARVLDLSRAAFAYLAGRSIESITNTNAGLLTLTDIRPVPRNTPLGPVR